MTCKISKDYNVEHDKYIIKLNSYMSQREMLRERAVHARSQNQLFGTNEQGKEGQWAMD